MEKALDAIGRLLRAAGSDERSFPATLLFGEGWMLRLVLDWFARAGPQDHVLSPKPGARWYSEARLASAFLPQERGHAQGEAHTHADGVLGHFQIGHKGRADLKLPADARQFIVIEAKLFSGLAKGTTRAPGYNQSARNVACMAEVVRRDACDPAKMAALAFVVLAPAERIDTPTFTEPMNRGNLERVVAARAEGFVPSKMDWFEDCFLPTFRSLKTCRLSWESVIAFIASKDAAFGDDLEEFYDCCVAFNQGAAKD